MIVQDKLKEAINKNKYKTRIKGNDESFTFVERRTFELSRFLLSMSKFIIERINSKYPTSDDKTFVEWEKILDSERQSDYEELLKVIHSFMDYYLSLDLTTLIESDPKGFTSPKNIYLAWNDFTQGKIRAKEEIIESARKDFAGYEEIFDVTLDNPEKPIWNEYFWKWNKSRLCVKAPFCPNCQTKLGKIMNIPPGSHHFNFVWVDYYNEPIYRFCPECGQRIDWSEPVSNQPIKKQKFLKIFRKGE